MQHKPCIPELPSSWWSKIAQVMRSRGSPVTVALKVSGKWHVTQVSKASSLGACGCSRLQILWMSADVVPNHVLRV